MGHALAEIATITGASIAAAQSRLVRGRKALAAWMTEARAKGRSHGGP
jgi:DNA-directed RNA polymerase specialized sigma24 family protein